jgi:hypothetical protein
MQAKGTRVVKLSELCAVLHDNLLYRTPTRTAQQRRGHKAAAVTVLLIRRLSQTQQIAGIGALPGGAI